MGYIDTHTHVYLPEFREDIRETVARAQKAGVERLYLPNIDCQSVEPMLELEKAFPDFCFPMMALHPGSVNENYRQELSRMELWLKNRKWHAIGETGIDLYWDTSRRKEQIESFEQHIEWALQYNLPIVVHSRNSFGLIMELLKPYEGKGLQGIFHCFTGSYEEARQVIDFGFYLGIGGILTYKNSGLDNVVEKTGAAHLVLETDAPYLPPVPHRGKRNEPAWLIHTAAKMATCLSIPQEQVMEQTRANALRLFNQDPLL